jgi:hypothetical protein
MTPPLHAVVIQVRQPEQRSRRTRNPRTTAPQQTVPEDTAGIISHRERAAQQPQTGDTRYTAERCGEHPDKNHRCPRESRKHTNKLKNHFADEKFFVE